VSPWYRERIATQEGVDGMLEGGVRIEKLGVRRWRSVTIVRMDDIEGILSGAVRPPQIPEHWRGEALPGGAGWRWLDPADRGNSVRFFCGEGAGPYVLITVAGVVIGRDGESTGERLDD
jgi:hypothetical protein